MKNYIFLLLIILFLSGCGCPPESEKIIAKINNYELKADEFENEFKQSSYTHGQSSQAKTDFLNYIINRKLILQEAEKEKLDRDPVFLKMVERFWEQSLITLKLDLIAKEIGNNSLVTDDEIKQVYEKMVKEDGLKKTYEQMYRRIKEQLTKGKQSKLLQELILKLRKSAVIRIDEGALK